MRPRLAMLALPLAAWLAWAPAARAADKATCLKAYESAQHERNAGKLRAARAKLLVCVEPTCPGLLRADCSNWLSEVDRDIPSVVVVARSGGTELSEARLLVDDEPLADTLTGTALEVDAGRRVFRVEAAGHAPAERTFTIRQGEKNRELVIELVPLEAPPVAEPSGPPTAAYVLAGIGAVGLVGFSYFGIKGLSGRSDLADCKGECPAADVDAVRADFTRADVSLAIAALAFGGAAYFYFGADGAETRPDRHRARLGITPRAGGVSTAVQISF